MTTGELRVYDTLEQGSDEWVAARCGILTASQIGKLITPTLRVADNETSRALTETIVAERLTGRVDYIYPTADMQRGTLDEPLARELYAEHFAPVTEVGFMVREFDGHQLGFSPDALVGDDGLFETKSRRPKTHIRTILNDTVPAENMAQLQCGLLVSGRHWIDYCSYAGGLPLYVKRVYPDPVWQTVLLAAHEQFEIDAAHMIDRFATTTANMPPTTYVDHFQEIEIS